MKHHVQPTWRNYLGHTRLMMELPVLVVLPPPPLLPPPCITVYHPKTWCADFTRQPDFVGHRSALIKVIWRHNWEVYRECCRAPSHKMIIQRNHHCVHRFCFPQTTNWQRRVSQVCSQYWSDLEWSNKLTSIVDIRDVKATVADVCSKACLDSYSTDEQETNYAVVLSNS